MDARMQLVFFGETLEGFERDEVKNRLGQLLKLDDAGRQKLFSGARMVLKHSLDEAEALRHAANFAKIGARLHVEAAGGPALVPPSASASASTGTPATPAEEQITCPNCGERQSRRILCRSCSTDMPMGIAAREEAKREEREARLAESRARRGLGATPASDAPGVLGFGFSGRMARLPSATANSWAVAAFFLFAWFFFQKPSNGRLWTFLVLSLLLAVAVWRWAILRCHDFNRSGWWTLLMGVPYLGFVVQLVFSFMPGTAGDNDHGGPPRPGSWVNFALSTVVVCASFVLLATAPWQEALAEFRSDAMSETSDEPPQVPAMLTSAKGRAAFSGPYAEGAMHKAFAMSSGGAWGWKVGAATPRAAVVQALATCEGNREPYSAPCELIHVNGQEVTMRQR
jgi:uncharacterized membrane protein YhaH (DUF805 family)